MTSTSSNKFSRAYGGKEMTSTSSSKFLPASPRDIAYWPRQHFGPSSTKPMLESALDFSISNSNSNKQTGKSGSVLSHPNLNKQTLPSRRVEFQPHKKQREYRTTYNSFQLQVLENAFSKDHYPDFLTKHKLAMKIGKSEIKICNWFQNRRAKLRKQTKMPFWEGFWEQQLQGPTYPHYPFKISHLHHLPASRMTTGSSSKPDSTSEPSSSTVTPTFSAIQVSDHPQISLQQQ